jgi:uncharacterized coiled-coil DUF342 family protein
MEKRHTLTLDKEFLLYCELNNIKDINKIANETFNKGFSLLKYGETPFGNSIEKEKIVEVIKEVMVEKIVEIIKEVPVEKIVEVIREVPIEKIVEVIKEVPIEVKGDTQIITNEVIKEVPIYISGETQTKIVEVIKEVEKPNEKMGMLQETLMKLRREIGEKDKTIIELNNKIEQLEKLVSNTGAVFMKGSNLKNNL